MVVHIPGQGSSLHGRVSKPSPRQSFPPCAGEGLVQVLTRFCIPPPHLTGHISQGFQPDQPPSTEQEEACVKIPHFVELHVFFLVRGGYIILTLHEWTLLLLTLCVLVFLFVCLFNLFILWMYDKALNVCSLRKKLVLFSLESLCFPRLHLGKHRDSRENKTNCFPREQTLSVQYKI